MKKILFILAIPVFCGACACLYYALGTPQHEGLETSISPLNENAASAKDPQGFVELASGPETQIYEKAEQKTEPEIIPDTRTSEKYYQVLRIVDGDTIDIAIDGKRERVRLIGINTPESVDPRKSVECFGLEASMRASKLLEGRKIIFEPDGSQDTRDKYGRLLGYIKRDDGLFYNLEIIRDGYAYEYTYQSAYKYQDEFKEAEKFARENKRGLWADGACGGKDIKNVPGIGDGASTSGGKNPNCTIKGNINSKKEKIYHLRGCDSYDKTVIDEKTGERWFCSEEEAKSAGWRKALNCK
jgi:micrococcal nuclease